MYIEASAASFDISATFFKIVVFILSLRTRLLKPVTIQVIDFFFFGSFFALGFFGSFGSFRFFGCGGFFGGSGGLSHKGPTFLIGGAGGLSILLRFGFDGDCGNCGCGGDGKVRAAWKLSIAGTGSCIVSNVDDDDSLRLRLICFGEDEEAGCKFAGTSILALEFVAFGFG